MVSFDEACLFPWVPIDETIKLLEFPPDDIFQVGGEFYEQVEELAMGSPLSPAVVNFYTETFKVLTPVY